MVDFLNVQETPIKQNKGLTCLVKMIIIIERKVFNYSNTGGKLS